MKPYSLDLRQRVLDAWQRGEGSQRQLAARFSVHLTFVRNLLRLYRQSGSLQPRPHGGGCRPLAEGPVLERLAQMVAQRPDDTLDEHRERLAAEGGPAMSRATLARALQRLKLTVKKKSLHASERDQERVQAERRAYREQLAPVRPEDLVFVDESGVNRGMTRLYARSPQGQRAYGSAPRNYGPNVSVLGALSLGGPLSTVHVEGAIDGEFFRLFVEQELVPVLWPGAVVVVDNLSTHKAAGVREAIEAVGARLVYLPPYSPDLNPIELAWSKLKSYLRKAAARTTKALNRALSEAIAAISPSDAQGYFAHCGYCG
jgi:transposase